MIRALLAHASRYYGLGWGIRRAFEFITQMDFSGLSAGRYDVEGDRIYALIQEKNSQRLCDAPFENHQRHADLQMTLSGDEWVGYCPVERLTLLGDYNAQTDVQLYTGTGSLQRSYNDSFALFFPEDGHQPYVTMTEPAPLRKLVMRIRLDTLEL